MNSSKPNKSTSKNNSLSNDESDDDSSLKLEIWENEGGAIDQTNVEHKGKEE